MHTYTTPYSSKMPTLFHLDPQENLVKKPKSFIQTIPFWLIFLSSIIFVFKYYLFYDVSTISHSSILNRPKFWFLVSNIIILIIAADFGAFRSSLKDDLYKEHPKDDHYYRYQPENDRKRSLSLPKLHPPKIIETEYSNHEEVKDIVVYEETKSSKYNKANNQIIAASDLEIKHVTDFREDDIVVHQLDSKADQEKRRALPCRHLISMSDGDAAIAVNDHNEKKVNVLYRSKTENFDVNTEENEFTSMSNEELNKRVEEFIKRCNRQIRLEAVARRIQEV